MRALAICGSGATEMPRWPGVGEMAWSRSSATVIYFELASGQQTNRERSFLVQHMGKRKSVVSASAVQL